MIQYYNSRTDDIESRRTSYYRFSLQYTAILLTAIGLLRAVEDSIGQCLFLFLVGLLSIQLISAVIAIAIFMFQSWFRYPFLQLGTFSNQWKWFYYGNKPVMDIHTRTIFPSKESEHTTEPYLVGLSYFVHQYLLEDVDEEISKNIKQLYLLQVHNYYKNQFYLQLYKVGTYAISFTVIYILIAGLIWLGRIFI